jgi:hypothetical protein
MVILLMVGPVERSSAPRHQRTLVAILQLSKTIDQYHAGMTIRTNLQTLVHISRLSVYSSASPLARSWYKSPTYQWLFIASIANPERSIIFALSRFERAIYILVRKREDLTQLLPLLKNLEDFFLLASMSVDKSLGRYNGPVPNDTQAKKRQLLLEFANSARPLIIKAARLSRAGKPPARWAIWFGRLREAPHVRYAVGISLVAAGVMALGVFLFKINLSQAFLTWFTVAFGSLTISIGVTAVMIKHEPSSPSARKEKITK